MVGTLRILASPSDGARLRWLRLGDPGEVLSQGTEAELPSLTVDGPVELIVPAERLTLVGAPVSPEQRSKLSPENLPWLAEPYLISEAERLHVARGDFDEEGRLALCIVDDAWLSALVARLAEFRLRPSRIVPDIFLAPYAPANWTVVLRPGGGFVRYGPQRALALDQCPHGKTPEVLKRLVGQLPPERILVLWSDLATEPDCQPWEDDLAVPVDLGGVWIPAHRLPDQVIDLAFGRYAPPGRGATALRRLRPGLALAAALLLINLAGLLASLAFGVAEKQRLQAEIEASLRAAFPETTVILDPLRQMTQNVERLNRAAGKPTRSDFLPMLGTVGSVLGKELSGRIENLSYDSGTLGFELAAEGALSDTLQAGLRQAGFTSKIENLPPTAGGARRIKVSVTP